MSRWRAEKTALDPHERATLVALCEKIAARRGLNPGVHPGFRNL